MFRSGAGNVLKSPWAKALVALVVIGVVGAAIAVPVAITLTQTTTAGSKYHAQLYANMDRNRLRTSLVLSFQ